MIALTDFPLAPNIARLVDDLIGVVGGAVRSLRRQFSPQSNAAAFADVRAALRDTRRLAILLKHAFVIMAATVVRSGAPAAPAKPHPTERHPKPRGGVRRPRLALWRRWRRPVYDDMPTALQPAALACATRDGRQILTRRLQALSHALATPNAHVSRLVRRLRRDSMVLTWRPPRRAPRTEQRAFWDELLASSAQAWFEIHQLMDWRIKQWDSS